MNKNKRLLGIIVFLTSLTIAILVFVFFSTDNGKKLLKPHPVRVTILSNSENIKSVGEEDQGFQQVIRNEEYVARLEVSYHNKSNEDLNDIYVKLRLVEPTDLEPRRYVLGSVPTDKTRVDNEENNRRGNPPVLLIAVPDLKRGESGIVKAFFFSRELGEMKIVAEVEVDGNIIGVSDPVIVTLTN